MLGEISSRVPLVGGDFFAEKVRKNDVALKFDLGEDEAVQRPREDVDGPSVEAVAGLFQVVSGQGPQVGVFGSVEIKGGVEVDAGAFGNLLGELEDLAIRAAHAAKTDAQAVEITVLDESARAKIVGEAADEEAALGLAVGVFHSVRPRVSPNSARDATRATGIGMANVAPFAPLRGNGSLRAGYPVIVPVFEYRCQSCGRKFSALIGMTAEPDDERCPHCGAGGAQKLVSRFARVRNEDDRIDEVADRLEAMGEPDSPSEMREIMKEVGRAMDEDVSGEMEEMFEADMAGGGDDEE